jgi:hypothetical protein
LPDLIRLGFPGNFLQIHQLGHNRMFEDVMAAVDARQLKTEALDELTNVSKPDVLKVAVE